MTERGDKLRQDVLGALRQCDGPLTAYEVMDRLRANYPKIAPTTVYRALTALIDNGCVHRIESLNAYIACNDDMHHCDSILSICDDCGLVDERAVPELLTELSSVMSQSGFKPTRHIIEVHGLCGSCGTEKARD